MKKWSRVILRVIAVAVVLYAIACVIVAVAYRTFLYPAPNRAEKPADAREVKPTAIDGKVASALRFGADDARVNIAFFHGNGEIAADSADLARKLALLGYGVVLAEYRGYGLARAEGAPTEAGIYADAEAILGSLPMGFVVLMGFSLGTGVAVEMAARGHADALVLLAPYTSIPAVAAHHVPLLPMNFLMRDKFDSLSKAASIKVPVFVAHGDADEVVPFDMGETLAHTFPHGQLDAISGAHHTDMFAREDRLLQKIIDFLIDVAPP
jgi:fermentation-respiration switch protein FrsA (DUF1100 family)